MFWRKNKQSLEDSKKLEIKSTLNEFLDEMIEHNMNRVAINVIELPENSFKRPGNWLNTTTYYPEELFVRDEISLINSEKSYQIASLVSGNAGKIPGLLEYFEPGIEGIERFRLIPRLGDLKKYSSKFYQTKPVFFNLNDAVDMLYDSEVDLDDLRYEFKKGVREYKDITRRLFETAGVYDSLKKLDERRTESDKVYSHLKSL